MEDFNQYVKNTSNDEKEKINSKNNLLALVSSLATKFDGKSQKELLLAIYQEAKKGKENGTLTNQDIDNFAQMLTPILDNTKRKILNKVVNELKKI